MKKLIALSLIFSSLHLSNAMTSGANSLFCNIIGSIYFTTIKAEADVSIYVEESEGFSDLAVFKVDDAAFADRVGLWHITDERAFADHIIFIESTRSFADFSVFFTDIEAFSGCNQ